MHRETQVGLMKLALQQQPHRHVGAIDDPAVIHQVFQRQLAGIGERMLGAGDHRQGFLDEGRALIQVGGGADGGTADRQVQAPRIELAEQRGAGVFDNLDGQLRVVGDHPADRRGQQRHGAHDGADRHASALAAHDADDLFAQVRKVSLDQPRVPDDRTPGVVRLKPAVSAGEQRSAESSFNFLQRLARAGLGQRDLFGRAQQRAVLIQGDQQTELLDVQAGHDRVQ